MTTKKQSATKTLKGSPKVYTNSDNWYEATKAEVVNRLWPYIQWLETVNSTHFNRIIQNHKLYTNQHISFGRRGYFQPMASIGKASLIEHSTLNAVQSCVDTVTSRVAGTAKPGIQFSTDGRRVQRH